MALGFSPRDDAMGIQSVCSLKLPSLEKVISEGIFSRDTLAIAYAPGSVGVAAGYKFEPSVTTTRGSSPQFLRFLRNRHM